MFDTRHSLCITYPSRNNPDQYLFFRVADYDIESYSFSRAPFSPVDEDHLALSYDPKIIGDKRREALANMAVIRAWDVIEDDIRKTISYGYPGTVYEVIFPKELAGIDITDSKQIREVLFSGISIDENASNDLLIVVGSLPSHYAVLHCKKKDLTFSGGLYKASTNKTDMLHSIHFFNRYNLNTVDLIATEGVMINLPDGRVAPIRYFYRFTELPTIDSKFYLFEFSSYMPQYISRCLKKKKAILQFSENDLRKIVACIDEILHDYDQATEYLAVTGYDMEHLDKLLPEYAEKISKELLDDTDADKILSRCVLNSNEVWQRCVEIVRTQWLAEKTEEKDRILDEIADRKIAVGEASQERDHIQAQVNNLDVQRKEIEADILQSQNDYRAAEAQLVKVKADIINELARFSEDVVHNVALCSVIQSVSGSSVKSSSPIHVYSSIAKCTESSELITDKDDLEDALAENLTVSGFDKNNSYEMAQLIVHCVMHRNPLIVNSGNGMVIANSLSTLFGGQSASVVNIPIGYYDLADISNKIRNTSSPVVFITGVFDGFSENIYHAIKGSCDDKTLIISTDGVDINLLTPDIWVDAYCIDGDNAFDFYGEGTLTAAKINGLTFNPSYAVEEIKVKKKLLKSFIEAGIISNVAAIQYSKFMVDINSDVKSDWLLLLQLCINAQATHTVDKLLDVFEAIGVDDKMKALLSKYM